MANRLYIVPAIGGSKPFVDPRRPKYIADLVGQKWAAMDYGFNPLFLVGANLSVANDAAVVANADVVAFPFDLAPAIGGGQALQNAKDALEAVFIPAQWVAASDTWLSVARTVAGMFQYMQRLNVILGNIIIIDDATKLNVQWSSVPQNIQTGMSQAAVSLGYPFNPQANTQVRALLKTLADAWGVKSFQLNDIIF